MQLRRPEAADKEQVIAMMQEFKTYDSPHDGGFWPEDSFDYLEWLEQNYYNEIGLNIPEYFVPSIQFVAFDENKKAIGFLSLRLRLNDALLQEGGHIGYSVRPSERGNGYAKEMLKLGINQAKSKGIKELLLTCHTSNLASRTVILANQGILENTQNQVERYWITVK